MNSILDYSHSSRSGAIFSQTETGWYFFLFLHKKKTTNVVGTHQKCLSEAFLMNTHNIWLSTEIKKKYQYFLKIKSALSGTMFLLPITKCLPVSLKGNAI